jgi:hypothetical protein
VPSVVEHQEEVTISVQKHFWQAPKLNQKLVELAADEFRRKKEMIFNDISDLLLIDKKNLQPYNSVFTL